MVELNAGKSESTPCCSPEVQEKCCEPEAKSGCCSETHGAGCGCTGGQGMQKEPVRERVRERYADAPVAAGEGSARWADVAVITDGQQASARPSATCCLQSRRPSGAGDAGGPDIARLGVSTDAVREFALGGLTRRLDIIGVPLSSL